MKTTGLTGHNQQSRFPATQIVSLLNDRLFIFTRCWSGPEIQQKVVDEISHFLSAANADLEVTTPFEYLSSLSSVANKVRISLLLANDLIYKTENKETYNQGCEIALVYQKDHEVVCASIGRFSFTSVVDAEQICISTGGQLLDRIVLLPTQLLGIDIIPNIQVNSVASRQINEIRIESNYQNQQCYWKVSVTDFE